MRRMSLVAFGAIVLLISLVLAGVVSAQASSEPDGLERVAMDHGFIDSATDSAVAGSPLADYGVSGVDNERLSVGLAGVIGVLVTALLAFGLFLLLRARRPADAHTGTGGEPTAPTP